MTSPEVVGLRLARAFGFGLTAFALSILAHVVAGGAAPSATVSLVLGFATVWLSVFLTWRRLGVVSSVVSLGLLQVLLHQALLLASAGEMCLNVVHSHAGHLASGATTMCSMPAMSAMSAATDSPQAHVQGAAGLVMTAAHALAAVLLGVLLARADAAVWFLSALIWPALPASPTVAAMVPQVRVAAGGWRLRAPLSPVLTGVTRRGPPRGLAAAA